MKAFSIPQDRAIVYVSSDSHAESALLSLHALQGPASLRRADVEC